MDFEGGFFFLERKDSQGGQEPWRRSIEKSSNLCFRGALR